MGLPGGGAGKTERAPRLFCPNPSAARPIVSFMQRCAGYPLRREPSVNHSVACLGKGCYISAIMVDVKLASRAEECRNRAEALRLLARKTRYPEIRDDLLKLAAGYDRLAAHIEAREIITADAAE